MSLFKKYQGSVDEANAELRAAAVSQMAEDGVISDGAFDPDYASASRENDSVIDEIRSVDEIEAPLLEDTPTAVETAAPVEVVAEAAQPVITEKPKAAAPALSAGKLAKIMGSKTTRVNDDKLSVLNNPALPESARMVEVTGEVAWFVGKVLCVAGDETKPVNGWCVSQYFDSTIRDHYKNGLHHCDDGPAYIKTGPINTVAYYKEGLASREDGPAIISTHDDGYVLEQYLVNGHLSRKFSKSDGGTVESFYKGTLFNQVRHAENGPAVIWTNPEGKVVGQEFYVDGQLHREDDKPALVHGPHTEWWVRGERHRINGPAVINRVGEGTYYIQGKEVSRNKVSHASLDERNNMGVGKAVDEIPILGSVSDKKKEMQERVANWKGRKRAP